jgi:hypothetical protein
MTENLRLDALGALDDLTQEDKFFLIQQIEDLNKNIRYCHESSTTHEIYQEDDLDSQQNGIGPIHSEQPTFIGKSKSNRLGYKGVRGGATGLDIILDEEEEMENELDYENSVKHGKQSPTCFFHGTNDAI